MRKNHWVLRLQAYKSFDQAKNVFILLDTHRQFVQNLLKN